jgi:hypothetical protein
MQNRLIEKAKLLDEKGNLKRCGYATSLVCDYSRNDIKVSKFKIKEWDYYYIGNQNYAVALTIADNGYMGLISASFLNFNTKYQKTMSKAVLGTFGKLNLPSTSEKGDVGYSGKGVNIDFKNDGTTRLLTINYENFDGDKPLIADIKLTDFPKDSMVIATPFDKAKHFYYNQKINCMTASGYCEVLGEKFSFDNNNSLGTLDWGRGVWTYKKTWYWGSLSAVLPDGNKFGFNIGYGFGNTSAATENILFYNGVAHKLNNITFNIPQKDGKDDFMSPWTFTSDDKRFEMNFVPVLNRAACVNAYVLCSDQNQVFGKFSGKAVLDDGKIIELKDVLGFAEKVFNKW